jgi:uncharacterized protein (DUF488 family)
MVMASGSRRRGQRVELFTIGFTKKSAEEFFEILCDAGVRRVVDIRLNNVSQLAGFTKREDLAYFLDRVAGIEYAHLPVLAPTQDLIDSYRKKGKPFEDFAREFKSLMKKRAVESLPEAKLHDGDCLLCSEVNASECHRSLVAAYLAPHYKSLKVTDL